MSAGGDFEEEEDVRILALIRKDSTREDGLRLFYELRGVALIRALGKKFRTMDTNQIDDLLTDAVIKMILADDVRPPVSPWLFTVARNEGTDIIRKQKNQPTIQSIEDHLPFLTAPPEKDELERDRTEECMARLSPQQQEIMRADLGQIAESDRELADMLGTTELNIRQARFKAHTKFRKCMEEGES